MGLGWSCCISRLVWEVLLRLMNSQTSENVPSQTCNSITCSLPQHQFPTLKDSYVLTYLFNLGWSSLKLHNFFCHDISNTLNDWQWLFWNVYTNNIYTNHVTAHPILLEIIPEYNTGFDSSTKEKNQLCFLRIKFHSSCSLNFYE